MREVRIVACPNLRSACCIAIYKIIEYSSGLILDPVKLDILSLVILFLRYVKAN